MWKSESHESLIPHSESKDVYFGANFEILDSNFDQTKKESKKSTIPEKMSQLWNVYW